MNLTDPLDRVPLEPLPERLAAQEFGADWGLLTPSFRLNERLATGPYRVGVLLYLHKNGVGNHSVVFLASDPETLSRHTNDPAVGACLRLSPEGPPR